MNPEELHFIKALDGRTIAIDASSEPYQICILKVHIREYPDHRADITGQFVGQQVRDFFLKGIDPFDLIPEHIDRFMAKLANRINIEETGPVEVDFAK